MEDLAAAIEASRPAALVRASRWAYPAVSALHVLGVALLVGSILPMDLRLAGIWRPRLPLGAVLDLLRPAAAAGAALALATGTLLFAVQARDYAGMPIFWVKMALIGVGLAHALAWGGRLAAAAPGRRRLAGMLSMAVWLTVLGCGRMLGYL